MSSNGRAPASQAGDAGSIPVIRSKHSKIPKSLKLRDFLYLSMVCGDFVPYIFQRNHTKINVDIHVLTCNFTSKIYDNFLMRF